MSFYCRGTSQWELCVVEWHMVVWRWVFWCSYTEICTVHALMLYYSYCKLSDLDKLIFFEILLLLDHSAFSSPQSASLRADSTVLHPGLSSDGREIIFPLQLFPTFLLSLKTHLFMKYLMSSSPHWIISPFSTLHRLPPVHSNLFFKKKSLPLLLCCYFYFYSHCSPQSEVAINEYVSESNTPCWW